MSAKVKKPKGVRRHEVTDPNPISIPVKFQKPPTLQEQIARYMGAHERFVAAQQGDESIEDIDDFGDDDDDEIKSPHELVFDPLLNRELPRFEYEQLARGREKFDTELQRQIRAEKAALAATKNAEALLDAKRNKTVKKTESAEADE